MAYGAATCSILLRTCFKSRPTLRVIEALNASLDADGALLDDAQLTNLRAEIAELVKVRENAQQPSEIKAAIEKVDNASSEFASRRMDASIKKALTGQSVDNI